MLDEAYHSVATRAFQGQLLKALVSVESVFRRHFLPRAIGAQLPGEDVVGELDLEDLGEAGTQLQVCDWDHSFNAAVQVGLHEVGGTEGIIRLGAPAGTADAREPAEAAHGAADPG